MHMPVLSLWRYSPLGAVRHTVATSLGLVVCYGETAGCRSCPQVINSRDGCRCLQFFIRGKGGRWGRYRRCLQSCVWWPMVVSTRPSWCFQRGTLSSVDPFSSLSGCSSWSLFIGLKEAAIVWCLSEGGSFVRHPFWWSLISVKGRSVVGDVRPFWPFVVSSCRTWHGVLFEHPW